MLVQYVVIVLCACKSITCDSLWQYMLTNVFVIDLHVMKLLYEFCKNNPIPQ